jgi:hypothetical protein
VTVPGRQLVQRALVLAIVAGAAVVASASPAAAHGIGGTEPTNYETTLTRVQPAVRGIDVEVIDLGDHLRLTNDTGRDVVVLGYDGEPYLRVGPRGVFENRRSPATYLNRSRVPDTRPPAAADADAAPEWQRVGDGRSVSWHDHRAHFMGSQAPPVVQDDPDRRHVLDRWTVVLRDGERTIRVRGLLTWVPPPSPWPWVAVAVGTAALVIGLSRKRWWRAVLVVALAALVVSAFLHACGHWQASSAAIGTKAGESIYSILGVALGLFALIWAWRRGVEAAVPFVLIAAIFLLVAGGLADISTLGHSQVPSSLAPTVARLAVALTIGLGAGLAVAAALRLRVVTPPGAPHPRGERPSPVGVVSTASPFRHGAGSPFRHGAGSPFRHGAG